MILRDFKCDKCYTIKEELVDRSVVSLPCECGGTRSSIWIKAPVVHYTIDQIVEKHRGHLPDFRRDPTGKY
jgi:hypothetical protein